MKALYSILLMAWLAWGTYFCNKKFCGTAEAKPAATAAPVKADCDVSLKFIDGDLDLTTKSNFQFGGSNYKFKTMPNDQLVSELKIVADYLTANPDRALQIEGLYLSAEKIKDKSFDNIGLARASTIKEYLVNELGMNADQLMLGGKQVKRVCYSPKSRTVYKGANFIFGEKI